MVDATECELASVACKAEAGETATAPRPRREAPPARPTPEAFGELCGRYALEMQPESLLGLCTRFGVWFPGVE